MRMFAIKVEIKTVLGEVVPQYKVLRGYAVGQRVEKLGPDCLTTYIEVARSHKVDYEEIVEFDVTEIDE